MRKGNGEKKLKNCDNTMKKDYDNAYIIGTLIGDGYFYEKENRIQLTVKDKEFAEKFKDKLENYTKKQVAFKKYEYYDVRAWLGNDKILKEKEYILDNLGQKHSKEYIKGLIDGLFDSEGSIYIKNNFPVIKYGTTSEKEAELYKFLLNELGVKARLNYSNPVYYVSITNKKNCKKFMETFSPVIKRKTKNYYDWKKEYEASYNKWSEEEVEILIEEYPDKGSDIKKLRNNDRTRDDIRTKANTLGISKR